MRPLPRPVASLVADGGLARYRLTFEPWTALLTHRRNALIFQDLDTRGVLEQVFADYPQADFRFDVTRALPVRAITTQYRESDWDFATRLLAEAGLAWPGLALLAAQPGEGDQAGHNLVILDQRAARGRSDPPRPPASILAMRRAMSRPALGSRSPSRWPAPTG